MGNKDKAGDGKGVRGVASFPRLKDADTQIGRAFMEAVWGDRFDLEGEHFGKTPDRFIKMLRELTQYEDLEFTTFTSSHDEMIVVQNIDFVSLCAHHIVPFMGQAHIAYVPKGKIAGLSKFARVVKRFAADLTVQEILTGKIADFLEQNLQPQGVAVVMRAEHLCMTIRGVQSPGTITSTSVMRGCFADHTKQARSEFLQLIGKHNG